jgi:CheY-like chemotaxis protein
MMPVIRTVRRGVWIDDGAKEVMPWQTIFAKRSLVTDLYEDPRQGLIALSEHPHAHSFAFVDLDMPGYDLDGIDVLHRIRSLDPHLPVAVISGHLGEHKWDRQLEDFRRNIIFVAKPIPLSSSNEFERLISSLHQMIGVYERTIGDDPPSDNMSMLGSSDTPDEATPAAQAPEHPVQRYTPVEAGGTLEDSDPADAVSVFSAMREEPARHWGFSLFGGLLALAICQSMPTGAQIFIFLAAVFGVAVLLSAIDLLGRTSGQGRPL